MTIEILPNGLQLLQSNEFQKLGQDSILLAAFAAPRRSARVLDLGCGTGALALSVYRPDLSLTGLDIQEGAVAFFRQSIARNGVKIDAKVGDLREIGTIFPHGSFDYVVCNPPYFSEGLKSSNPQRNTIRHSDSLELDDLAKAAKFSLKYGGRLCICMPAFRLAYAINTLHVK